MPNRSRIPGQTYAYAACGAVLGAILRYLISTAWPTPPAFPAPPRFPTAGIASASLTIGVSLFVASFTFATVQKSSVRAFVLGICVGAASLSQYAVTGISTVAAAGLLLLILAPVCGLVGVAAGILVALPLRKRRSTGDAVSAETLAE